MVVGLNFNTRTLNWIQALLANIREMATGFFVGLFLLAGLFAALLLYQRHWDDLSQLPVIKGLSEVYMEGVLTLKEIGAETIDDFYAGQLASSEQVEVERLEAGLPVSKSRSQRKKGGQLVVHTSWDANRIVDKLKEKGFSGKKLKNAKRFIDYIEEHQGVAMRDMQKHQVLASIKLSQALLESNAGASGLATASKNQFGIKALPTSTARKKIKRKQFDQLSDADFVFKHPAVGVHNMHDDHHYDRFEKYLTVGDSYARHTQLLTRPCTAGNKGCYSWIWTTFRVGEDLVDLSRMAKLYQKKSGYKARDFFNGQTKVPYYAAAAAGLKMAGYATSRRYHQKIAYLIETYELWRLDVDLLAALKQAATSSTDPSADTSK